MLFSLSLALSSAFSGRGQRAPLSGKVGAGVEEENGVDAGGMDTISFPLFKLLMVNSTACVPEAWLMLAARPLDA